MQIQNLILMCVLFLASTTTYAQDKITFTADDDLLKCREYHNKSVVPGNADVTVADKYCLSRMGPVLFCGEQKLLKLMAQINLTDAQIIAYKPKFKSECSNATTAGTTSMSPQTAQAAQAAQQQQAQEAQLAQQQQAAAAQVAAKENQQTAAQAQQNKQQGLQQTGQLISALVPVVDKVESAYSKAADKAAETSGSSAAGKVETPAIAATKAPEVAPTPTEVMGPMPEATITAGGKTYTETEMSNMSVDERAGVFAKHDTEMAAKASEAQAAANGVKTEIPAAANEAEGAAGAAAKGGNVSPPPSEMTVASEKANTELKTQLNSTATTSGTKLVTGLPQTAFVQTQTALTSGINPVVTAYEGVKKTCLGLAEKTEFLCLEGTSPGVVATKTLMTAAGPILAAVNSAQKACSNTSKVTSLAGTVLTVAKGVCMASQLACSTSCTVALAKLNSSIATYSTQVQSAATSDQGTTATACTSLVYGSVACMAEAKLKLAAVPTILAQIKTIAQKEAAPTPGTSAGLGAKCKLKVADAIMMGLNIASLVAAKNSADECDKKLAASGAAGGGVTPTTYCETPANVSTQFCKCKSNNQQEGCPGYNASNSTLTDKEKEAALKGLDLKTGKGVTGFASSGSGGGSGSGSSGLDSLSQSSSADGTSGKLSLSDSGTVTAGGSGGGSNVNGSGGGGGGSSDASDKSDKTPKKWSFGSFAAAMGGMFGGGGSKGKGGNGNVTAKSNAIERKIASDKLAGEITSASGKSNWEKVRQVYLIKENTLLSGQ